MCWNTTLLQVQQCIRAADSNATVSQPVVYNILCRNTWWPQWLGRCHFQGLYHHHHHHHHHHADIYRLICRFCCVNKMHTTALVDIFQVKVRKLWFASCASVNRFQLAHNIWLYGRDFIPLLFLVLLVLLFVWLLCVWVCVCVLIHWVTMRVDRVGLIQFVLFGIL